ncbi:hypothetical protein AGMMS50276_31400 [Synergistales bacterium]|nr:hypothetical protein AGMMS50276_31400 [Synergistales bacterium]
MTTATATLTVETRGPASPQGAQESIPNAKTRAAMLESDEIARAYFARFAEDDIEN